MGSAVCHSGCMWWGQAYALHLEQGGMEAQVGRGAAMGAMVLQADAALNAAPEPQRTPRTDHVNPTRRGRKRAEETELESLEVEPAAHGAFFYVRSCMSQPRPALLPKRQLSICLHFM
eukprot:2035811-Rhodomonas_salina.9